MSNPIIPTIHAISIVLQDPVQESIISVLKLFLSQTDPTTHPPKHHHDGYMMDMNELREAMREDNPKLTEEQIQRRIADMDANHDGQISVREYKEWQSKTGNMFAAHMLPSSSSLPSAPAPWGAVSELGPAAQHRRKEQDANACSPSHIMDGLEHQHDQHGSSSHVSREELRHMLASMQKDTELGVERAMANCMHQFTTNLTAMLEVTLARVLGGGDGVDGFGGDRGGGGEDSGGGDRELEEGNRERGSWRSQEDIDIRIARSSSVNSIVTARDSTRKRQSQREHQHSQSVRSINRHSVPDFHSRIKSQVSTNRRTSSRHVTREITESSTPTSKHAFRSNGPGARNDGPEDRSARPNTRLRSDQPQGLEGGGRKEVVGHRELDVCTLSPSHRDPMLAALAGSRASARASETERVLSRARRMESQESRRLAKSASLTIERRHSCPEARL